MKRRPGAEDGRARRFRRRAMFLGLSAGLGLLAAAGFLFRDLLPAPAPPAVSLAGSDPAVARAVERAREEVRASPRSPETWGRLALVLHAHDFLEAARTAYARAGRLAPRDPRWPHLEALTCRKGVPDLPAMLPLLERAACFAGKELAPRLEMAEVLLEMGRVDAAEKAFKSALEVSPGNPRAELGLGRIAHRRGDLRAARERLERAVASAPRVRAARALLAETLFRLGDREGAERERGRLAGLPQNHFWPDPFQEEVTRSWVGALARIERANDLLQRGQSREAIELLERAVMEDPEALLARLSLGRSLLQAGEPARAEEALREAVRREPGSFEGWFELATALERQGKWEEAGRSLEETLARKPDYGPAHHALARFRLRGNDLAGAIGALEACLRHRPDLAAARRDLGALLLRAGRSAEAQKHLEDALRLNPEDAEARALLGGLR